MPSDFRGRPAFRWVALLGAVFAPTAPVFVQARGGGDPQTAAIALSRKPLVENRDWHAQVLAIPGSLALPSSVTVEGDTTAVAHSQRLVSGKGERTTLVTSAPGSTRLIVDMGVPVSGYVELAVAEASGAAIRMSYSEDRQRLTDVGDASKNPDDFFYLGKTLGTDDDPDGRADVFAPPGKAAVLRSAGLRGSQRYIAITMDGPGSLSLDFIRVQQTNFQPRRDGYFLSSDEQLNRAWYASAYAGELATVRNTRVNPNARWVVIDGPKRDRTVYTANTRMAGLAMYYQSSQFREVVRDSILLFACQQYPDGSFPPTSLIDVPCDSHDRGPPQGPPKGFETPGVAALARIDSYTAWWVISLADYLRYTGDKEFVLRMLPAARRAVKFFADHAPQGTLWEAGDYGGKLSFDWHPPDRALGIDAFTNEIYYESLRSLALLERSVANDSQAADALDSHAEKVRAALLETLWDPSAGAMVLNAGDTRRNHTADANVGALLFGVLDEAQAHRAMDFLEKKLGTPHGTANSEFPDSKYITQYVSPWIVAQEALGRFRYGDGPGALRLIRTTWTHMINRGPGTPWEELATDGSAKVPRPGTSLAEGDTVSRVHPWSNAVPALSMYLLGVRPTADGYKEWIVDPEPVDVRWAQGDVPTPAGRLSARWQRGDGDSSFTLTVEAPDGTSGSIAIPTLGSDRTIALDGRIVWRNGAPAEFLHARRQGDKVVFTAVTAGLHTFAWAH